MWRCAFDALHPDLICHAMDARRPHERRHVGAADALKAFRTDLVVFPALRGNGVPRAIGRLIAPGTGTPSLWRLQPLVRLAE